MPLPESQLLGSEAAPINRILPIETLTMIFLLLGPASFRNPYIYLPLSWVCRYWRSIVLDNSIFWSVITHKCNRFGVHHEYTHGVNHEFTRNAILRSKSHKIDVAWCRHDCTARSVMAAYIFSFKRSQIRTLFFKSSLFRVENMPFTQLENLIFSRTLPVTDVVRNLVSAANPRFIDMPSTLLCKQMSESLPRVEWLKLKLDASYYDNVDPSVVYYVLENLPSLRILNLISRRKNVDISSTPTITLPNLRMFSLDPWKGGLGSIQTPTLTYFGVSPCSYNWDHLNSIDLSVTKSLRIALCYHQDEPHFQVPIACISTGRSEEDCQFFKNFHASVKESFEESNVPAVSMDYFWTLPPTNSFHVSFNWQLHHEEFSHLKRATNLVELILDYQSIQRGGWGTARDHEGYQILLGKALESFDTVIHLTVLRCRSFVSICELLMDGQRLPHLKRLTYHNSYNLIRDTTFVPKRMAMVQSARIKASSEPLRILELQNFPVIPPKQAEKIEKLGIQLIQTSPIEVLVLK